ncbi:MAG: hypothetical protein IPN01_09940 [Deltaproteobacteria bacterium]|nr:hypothetical protein [Deltaproteobacteria bacterium]
MLALIAFAALGCRTAPVSHDTGWGSFEEMDIVEGPALHSLGDAALDCTFASQRPDALCPTPRTCLEHLVRRPNAPDGVYVIDPDGDELGAAPFEVTCDMASGGFTLIDGALIRAQGWMSFEEFGGEALGEVGWLGDDSFILDPVSDEGCFTVAVRGTARLPFTFEEWRGSWLGGASSEASQHDDVHGEVGWGEPPDDCRGYVKFGTERLESKIGGEWGMHWNSWLYGERAWSWAQERLPASQELRWEVADQGSPEDVVVSEIQIWVR